MLKVRRLAELVLVVGVGVGAIELGLRVLDTPAYIFPRPTAVLSAMQSQAAGVPIAWWTTVSEALAGLGVALIVSSLLAASVIFLPSTIARVIDSSAVAAQSTPILALAPLLSLWFGQAFLSKAAAAAIVCFFPLFTGWLAGVRSVELEQLELFENMKANSWQRARYLQIPNALPYFFSGLRVAVPLALLGAIVAEFVGSSEGIGFRILSNSYYVRTAVMFGYVLLAAGTGWAFTALVSLIEHRVLFWHGQGRET